MKITIPFIALALLMLQACAATKAPDMPGAAPVNKDPLIGQIIDSRDRSKLSFDTLVENLSTHQIIYLSEKHDNPMHHAVQHRIIQALINRGHYPVIGFEFFAMDHTPLLLSLMDSKQAGHDRETETALKKEMRKKLGWEDQTDTMWGYYWDLLSLARENGLWAAGLDLDNSLKRRITRKGIEGITPLEQAQVFSTWLSDPVYETHMKKIFKQVHCGMGNERMLSRLYDTWLARNDKMAQSIAQVLEAAGKSSSPKGPLVIIMGNGHTEYGLGVMDRVRAIAPGASQVNLSLSEIFPEPEPLDTYLAPLDLQGYPKALPADYIWFTGRVSNQDPCEKFKAVIEQMQKRKNVQE